MAFRKPPTQAPVPDSPDRLFRDLPRRKHASLYDHQGQILRTYVAEAKEETDVALQLPTGSGKTLVGLLLAEWRRRKFGERVVYLCPTRQLVNQVVDEATAKYGLSVEAFTGKVRTYAPEAKAAYQSAERVAVTTYSSLFNTHPFFSNPDVIILDDAHAAENYVASQWTLRIGRFEDEHAPLFAAVASVLQPVLSASNFARLTGDWHSLNDAIWVDKIATSKLATIADELHAAIAANVGDLDLKYAWRMLGDHLRACQLYVSSAEVLIRPLIPPTWSHRPFAEATQRIFMSATLGAGGDLERLTGRSKIKRLPIPDGWDKQGIGRRFFVFPEMSLDEGETLELRRELMRAARRSLVLTPTSELADSIRSDVRQALGYETFTAVELEDSKAAFTASATGVAVVANRYDGIDFPDDDCRLLFIEGLPKAANLQERFLMARMGANLLLNERVQTRVLQAIGRCTRGLNDYSAVVVTGQDLPAYLIDKKRRKYFHPELQAELQFGVEQSTGVDRATVLENFEIFLEHESEWEAANELILEHRETAKQSDFPAMDELAKVARHEITFQEAAWNDDHVAAYEAARDVLGGLSHPELRGYRALWHYLAGSAADLAANEGVAGFDSKARQQFKSAKEAAGGIPWLVALSRETVTPGAGTDADDEIALVSQVERLESYLAKLGTLHNRAFSAQEAKIRQGLASAKHFEQAQVLLGEHLGYVAGKRENDASPDPWWISEDVAIVFEDHAGGERTSVIDATKARQAASHPDWVKLNVPGAEGAKIVSVLVTLAKQAKSGAMPHLSRVSYWDLHEFRDWAERALKVVRELRREFSEPGDLAWRARAASQLQQARMDAPGLSEWLMHRSAKDHLSSVA